MSDLIDPIVLYNTGYLGIFRGTIDWANDNISAILLDNAYPKTEAHSTYIDVSSYVCTDADYSPVQVPSKSIAMVDDEIRYLSDAVEFGSTVTISARFLVLVKALPADISASTPLIGYVDFGELKSSTDAAFAYSPASTGWFRIQKVYNT